MDESDVWDSMADLYSAGKIERAGVEDGEMQFTLTDHGDFSAKKLLGENDHAVLYLMRIASADHGADEERAEAIESIAGKLRDDIGVNAFRVMGRYPDKSVVDVDGLDESFIERFDP